MVTKTHFGYLHYVNSEKEAHYYRPQAKQENVLFCKVIYLNQHAEWLGMWNVIWTSFFTENTTVIDDEMMKLFVCMCLLFWVCVFCQLLCCVIFGRYQWTMLSSVDSNHQYTMLRLQYRMLSLIYSNHHYTMLSSVDSNTQCYLQ